MASVVTIFHSGYGHTKRQAEAVHAGAAEVLGEGARLVEIDADGNLPEGTWDLLEQADAVLFGAPTYMGGPSWQFKKFADASSKPWFQQRWKDKLAGGFTNSASFSGDKYATLQYFWTLAMQHSMLWVSLGVMPANASTSQRDDPNRVGGYGGAMAQSDADVGPDVAPPRGDLDTARMLGRRVAELALRRG